MHLLVSTSAILVTLAASPLQAQEAPIGIFRCHLPSMMPAATLILDGQVTYQMIGTSTLDFVAGPSLRPNGTGQYSVSGTEVLVRSGPLFDHYNAVGTFLGGGRRRR